MEGEVNRVGSDICLTQVWIPPCIILQNILLFLSYLLIRGNLSIHPLAIFVLVYDMDKCIKALINSNHASEKTESSLGYCRVT